MSVLSLHHVTFGYNGLPLVEDLSLEIGAGESWAILGPSGSGKTTLLYLMAGLRKPQRGKVCFRGAPLTGPSTDVGLMLQAYGLLPWMTAAQNIALGLKIRGIPRQQRQPITADWLRRMQINAIADNFPAQMSGGQRQRVALARVLALQTDVLLLDEPLSAVDELTRERLQKTLYAIQSELKRTMLLVTHSVEEAVLLADNILVFPEEAPLTHPVILRSPFATQDAIARRDDPTFQHFTAEIRETLGL